MRFGKCMALGAAAAAAVTLFFGNVWAADSEVLEEIRAAVSVVEEAAAEAEAAVEAAEAAVAGAESVLEEVTGEAEAAIEEAAGSVEEAESVAEEALGAVEEVESAVEEAAEAAAPKVYQIGDVVDDFTVLLHDGQQVSLYELLEDHDAVFLNFFATWCGPCHLEYPYISEAAAEYEDVAVLTISADPSDTAEMLEDERKNYQLDYMTALCNYDLDIAFNIQSIPTSFMIDRNKVLCWTQLSAFASAPAVKTLFRDFSADDYSESLVNYEIPAATPETAGVTALSSEELSALINAEGSNLVFNNSGNEIVFPFIDSGDGGVAPSNLDCPGTMAECSAEVEVEAGDVLAFTWEMDGAIVLENAFLRIDGSPVKSITGKKERSEFAYRFEEPGTHTVAFDFVVNVYDTPFDEYFMTIRDVRLLTGEEAEKTLAAQPVWPAVLEGNACALSVKDKDAREVIVSIDGESDDPRRFYIAKGAKADVHVHIGAETDPDITVLMLISRDYGYHCLSEFETDEEGFVIPLELMNMDEDGYPYNMVQVLLDGGISYGPGLVICADEENMDATLPYLSQSQNITWSCADGGSPDSAEEPAEQTVDSAAEEVSPGSVEEMEEPPVDNPAEAVSADSAEEPAEG